MPAIRTVFRTETHTATPTHTDTWNSRPHCTPPPPKILFPERTSLGRLGILRAHPALNTTSVMSHQGESHVTYMLLTHTYEWVMSHENMIHTRTSCSQHDGSHVTSTTESCLIHA